MTWFLGAVKGFFGGIWGYAAAAGAALIAVLAVYRSGKSSGINEVVVESAKKEIENVRTANEVEREIVTAKPDERRDRLHDSWSRD